MGRKANPAIIGAFVLGAIALAVVGVTVFGSGQLFKQTSKFVLYFPGSVDGLNAGAPVKFKGVEIGSVTDIRINLGDYRTQQARIPVFVELDTERIAEKGVADPTKPDNVRALIYERGLRGQLQPQSILTGLLFVQLDLFPDTPVVMVLPPDSPYREIPTIPTTLEQAQQTITRIFANLEKADIEGMLTTARGALDGIHQLVNKPELHQAVEALPGAIAKLDDALASFRKFTSNLDGQTTPMIASIRQTAAQADAALAEVQATVRRLDGLLRPDSPLAGQVSSALQELSAAARSVRLLADYLERNPSAIVRGRAVDGR